MAFLKQELRKQKFLEAEVDIDNYIDEKKITDNAMIFEISLSKKVYKTDVEAQEFLNDKGYYGYELSETPEAFVAKTLSSAQLDMTTLTILELRRGVVVKAADLKPIIYNSPEVMFSNFDLSLKGETINLSEGLPYIIEVCRVAKGHHAVYGDLEITPDHIASFERNFNEKVTDIDLAVNEDHKKEGAFGWFKEVFKSFEGDKLFAVIDWNAKGITALSDKLYRYFSPEFRFNYTHPLTGAQHGPTLMGGALTNYPFLKMDAITELNQKQSEDNMAEKDTIALSEHQAKVIELSNKVSELMASEQKTLKIVESMKSENVELSNKVSTLEKEKKEIEAAKAKADKEAKNQKLFSEGKINKAQLVALNEGKDILEVLALSGKMHVDPNGTDETPAEEIELSEGDKIVMKKLGLTPEQFKKHNS